MFFDSLFFYINYFIIHLLYTSRNDYTDLYIFACIFGLFLIQQERTRDRVLVGIDFVKLQKNPVVQCKTKETLETSPLLEQESKGSRTEQLNHRSLTSLSFSPLPLKPFIRLQYVNLPFTMIIYIFMDFFFNHL